MRTPPHATMDYPPPEQGRGRARLFFIVFATVLAVGVSTTILLPAKYESRATLLMTPPQAIDDQPQLANAQGVAIQLRVLLGAEITAALTTALRENEALNLNSQYLRNAMRVEPIADTNLVELVANGPDADVLPAIVSNWIDIYLEKRAVGIQQNQQQTLRLVREQLAGLEVKLEEARQSISEFRAEHGITSAQSEDNEVMAKLSGLQSALNNALEAEVAAQSNLRAAELAISEGERVAQEKDSERAEKMELQLRNLKLQQARVATTYTEQYIEREPRLRNLPQKIAQLEADLEVIYARGEAQQLAALRRERLAAQGMVEDLQEKIDAHETSAAAFTNTYATHQTLVADLARLEELHRESQARLIAVQVNPIEKYPQVEIIDRPAPAPDRIGPNYAIWLGGSLLAALVTGVLVVWLYAFLVPRREQPAYVTLSGVHMYPQDVNVSGQLGPTDAAPARLPEAGNQLLQNDTPSQDDPTDGASGSHSKQ